MFCKFLTPFANGAVAKQYLRKIFFGSFFTESIFKKQQSKHLALLIL